MIRPTRAADQDSKNVRQKITRKITIKQIAPTWRNVCAVDVFEPLEPAHPKPQVMGVHAVLLKEDDVSNFASTHIRGSVTTINLSIRQRGFV